MSEKPCYIYVITIDELGLSKVGISDNPNGRLKQLSTGSPFKMRLAHAFWVPERNYAVGLERGFHSVKKNYRRSGEWFEMSSEDAIGIMLRYILDCLTNLVRLPPDQIDVAMANVGIPAGFEPHIESYKEAYRRTALQ